MVRKPVHLWLILIVMMGAACTSAPTPEPIQGGNATLPAYPLGSDATIAPNTASLPYPVNTDSPSTPALIVEATLAPTTAPPAQTNALPAGPLTIVALGDSLTEGQGDDSGLGGYPGRLLPLIQTLRPGSRLVNVAHSGWTSTDLINGHDADPSELTQALAAAPNIALIWMGSNDLWYLYEYGPEPMTAAAEAQDLLLFGANLDTLLSRLRDAGAQTFIALLDDQSQRPVVANPPNPNERAFPATTTADLARMAQHVVAYNDVIRQKAQQYGAVTVDFSGTTIFTDPATLYGDGNHPNEAGYEAITRLWWAALETELK